MNNTIFITTLGFITFVSIIAHVVLDNKRKIAHTATFNDDPAGSISDLLIWVSFVFAALFVTFALIFPVLDKHKIEYCRHFISEKSQSHNILIQKELAYCTMLIKNK